MHCCFDYCLGYHFILNSGSTGCGCSPQVKNTHAAEVNIEVCEQVPLSTDERIKVCV